MTSHSAAGTDKSGGRKIQSHEPWYGKFTAGTGRFNYYRNIKNGKIPKDCSRKRQARFFALTHVYVFAA